MKQYLKNFLITLVSMPFIFLAMVIILFTAPSMIANDIREIFKSAKRKRISKKIVNEANT